MDHKKIRQLKLLRGPQDLDPESREIHESGLRIDRRLRYDIENAILPVFYLYLAKILVCTVLNTPIRDLHIVEIRSYLYGTST
jgi:hypothetical protein